MTNKKTKIAAAVMSAALLTGMLSIPSAAVAAPYAYEEEIQSYEPMSARAVNEVALRYVTNKNIYTYSRRNINYESYGGGGNARLINGMEYVSLRAFASAIGAGYTYNKDLKTASVNYGTSVLTVGNGAYTMYINERPIFALSPAVIMSDGLMYVPLASLLKAYGMSMRSASGGITVAGRASPLSAGMPYSQDEVFWLARIIEAESSGESLIGKIGVGTVVLNRVRSPLYPNTIYGVIFDRKYGVQFSPVMDGRIYNTPSYQAKLAARICLEGYRISDEALFFLAPEHATSSWIPNSRKYLFSIMHHDFYA